MATSIYLLANLVLDLENVDAKICTFTYVSWSPTASDGDSDKSSVTLQCKFIR